MTTVLVVDDDTVERESMAATLASAGYEVLRADCATGALRMALRAAPDAIVLDLVLPDFHGTEAARAIRSVAGLTHVPIVAVTHDLRAARTIDPVTFGAECILRKPVLRHELLDAVSRCLQRRPLATGTGPDGSAA